jgi:hypothetical protein
MGLAAVAAHRLGRLIPIGPIFKASIRIGQACAARTATGHMPEAELRVLR